MTDKRKAPRDTVRPFSPAVGAARPHGVTTPTFNLRYVPVTGEYQERFRIIKLGGSLDA